MPLTRILVDVPMSVHIPPMMLANESGISNLEGLILAVAAMRPTIGMKTATTGVLLMNADTTATRSISNRVACLGLLRKRSDIRPASICSAPVFNKAAESTNMKATVRVAPLLKPSRPSPGLITPVVTNPTMMSIATKSTVSHSVMKRMTAARATSKVI